MTSIIEPGDVDTMPGWEWYNEQAAELADDLADLRHLADKIGYLPEVVAEIGAELARIGEWRCPACGGPRSVPDLADTLRYPACGYGQVETGWWVHA